MCKYGQWEKLNINGKTVNIDKCLVKSVKVLNDNGFKTMACCCGHGKQPPRISFEHKELLIFDYETAQKISKLFHPIN